MPAHCPQFTLAQVRRPSTFGAPFTHAVVKDDKRDTLARFKFRPCASGWAVRRVAKATGFRFVFDAPTRIQLGDNHPPVDALAYIADGYPYVRAYLTTVCPDPSATQPYEEL